ncbi:MAG: transketolase [Chloroflexota bacterium]
MNNANIEELCINTIRFLAVDAVEQARSGHPGAPMGAAPLAYVLWDRFLKHNPLDPRWPDRDRFILSAGHASAMLYALLYLTGYDLTLEDIKQFRQWGSKTPGHPEHRHVPGVESTTGPLGQGFANGVGIAMAERWLAQHYNRPGHEIIDHYTYAIVSDGDLQEGVASEAASLAGTLRLGKLIYLYDDNDISIEGSTEITFTEDVGKRFEAYGWQVLGPIDGMSPSAVDTALRAARKETTRPSLIICRTIIGYGSPNKAGTAAVHGEPLGTEEIALARKDLGWHHEPFEIPPEALAHFRQAVDRGRQQQAEWEVRLQAYRQAFPAEARQLEESLRGDLPPGWADDLDNLFPTGDKPVATREASSRVMNAISPQIPYLIGGSADLAPSTKTILKERGHFSAHDYGGHNLHFGVREHAMGSVASGLALHGGIIPYTATFLIFSDYMRPPMRLAAMMRIRVIYIFSHDSIGLGEDGPTHQPIEQLASLRAVPNLVTIRPADATETVEAWKVSLARHDGPTALLLTRQNLPVLDRQRLAPAAGLQRGGYILQDNPNPNPDVILIGTGSEVHIALEAGQRLQQKGIAARVVSLPSWELFEAQPIAYRNEVLPPEIKARVAIEAATPFGWERYVGTEGIAIGLRHFGASAPGPVLYEKFGLTPDRMVEEALKLLGGKKR